MRLLIFLFYILIMEKTISLYKDADFMPYNHAFD